MESPEVLVNGGIPKGGGVCSNGCGLVQVNGESVLERVGSDGEGKGNLADEVLEDLEEYWEDINDRLMISRMVSDSVIKGMVTAVEQEAAARIAAKELEVAALKDRLKFHEDVEVPVREGYEAGSCGRFSCFSDACAKHEKMREDLRDLRNVVREEFEKAKKEVECARGCNSMKKIGSGSELVGLSEILQETQSESLVHVDKMLEYLKTTLDTVCMKMDGILHSSEISLCELREERDLSAKLEDIVIQSVLGSLQEEFEEKSWEQNARLSGIEDVNWLDKFNDISSLGTQLDAILKSLSIPETGLVSHGSHDFDHLHHKGLSNISTSSFCKENGTPETSDNHVPESYDFQQLSHLSKEGLVHYFNSIIIKMRRDHESTLHQKTEEYFRLRREYLKVRGSVVTHRKDEEFDVLRKKIPEVILKLEKFLLENERFPALANSVESMGEMKDRLECLLSENRQLRESLAEKKNEVQCLEAQVSDAAAKKLQSILAEKDTLKLVANLNSAVEDSCIEASLNEEVHKCALKELIEQIRGLSEDSDMKLLLMQEIYEVILIEAANLAESTSRFGIEEPDIESLITQGLNGFIFTEAVKDAWDKHKDLYQGFLNENEIRIRLEKNALEKENDLQRLVEEREKLNQELLALRSEMEQKEKLAVDLSVLLLKGKEQFQLVSQELASLNEQANQQQRLVVEKTNEFELLSGQLKEALEQIEVDKVDMYQLNEKLAQAEEALTEIDKDRNKAYELAREMRAECLSSEGRNEELKKKMEMTISEIGVITKMFDDFEFKVAGALKNNNLRLEDTSSHLKALTDMASALSQTGEMYRQGLERRGADLQMAEAEVDLLGDEVDAQLGLLEKVYIALDHYSPILKHYPGITEILELVRRELTGESSKLSCGISSQVR